MEEPDAIGAEHGGADVEIAPCSRSTALDAVRDAPPSWRSAAMASTVSVNSHLRPASGGLDAGDTRGLAAAVGVERSNGLAAAQSRMTLVDDFVGRLHSVYERDGTRIALEEWRITTGDPEVADRVHELYEGEAPEEWETKSERNIQVFTDASSIDVVVADAKAIRQRMILWGNDRKPVYISDGEYILDDAGQPTSDRDPDADLRFQERKDKKNYGANPSAEITFRLADDPSLGIFVLKSNSWGLAYFLAAEDIEGQIEAVGGPAILRLKLVPVSFIAKNGPRKGKTVSYTSIQVEVLGASPGSGSQEDR